MDGEHGEDAAKQHSNKVTNEHKQRRTTAAETGQRQLGVDVREGER
jgi:hypothetical protein